MSRRAQYVCLSADTYDTVGRSCKAGRRSGPCPGRAGPAGPNGPALPARERANAQITLSGPAGPNGQALPVRLSYAKKYCPGRRPAGPRRPNGPALPVRSPDTNNATTAHSTSDKQIHTHA